MSIRTLIVDDEPLARERIKALLEDESDIEVVGECASGRKAVSAIQRQAPDLLFLDVQMPELDGFGVLATLDPERLPVVIFVTAYDQYALRAFEVHALDYLLKPFDRERFKKALERVRAELQRDKVGDLSQRLLALLEDIKPEHKSLKRVMIKSDGRVYFVKAEEIDWIEAAGNYVRLHVGGKTHLQREKMNELESRLDPERFVRIHRSTIVNIETIKELEPWFRGEYVVVLHDGTRLILTRSYRDKLQRVLGKPF